MSLLQRETQFHRLFTLQGLRLHPLSGQREGQYAVNLTGRWRLVFTVNREQSEVTIQEVSNHYDD